jgi:hypothetical protein
MSCSGGGAYEVECDECYEGFDIWDEDGSCYETHCEEFSPLGVNACHTCIEDYVLNTTTSLCQDSCQEDYVIIDEGEDGLVCIIDCDSEVPSGFINSYWGYDDCVTCDSVV